jgi:hypothetical protein
VTRRAARVIVSAAMAPDDAKLPGTSQRDGLQSGDQQREGRVA